MENGVRSTITEGEPPGKLSLHLVEAIAAARGTTPDDLDLCLHDYLDVAALAELFESVPTAPTREGSVSFSVDEVLVTVSVRGDERIDITAETVPAEAPRSPERGRS